MRNDLTHVFGQSEPSTSMSDELQIRNEKRATDKDRETAVGLLSTAFAEGAFPLNVFHARIKAAYSADTKPALDNLVSDVKHLGYQYWTSQTVKKHRSFPFRSVIIDGTTILLGAVPAAMLYFGTLINGWANDPGGIGPALCGIGIIVAMAWILFAVAIIGREHKWRRK